MRVGLFGGTFDPPHIGHLIVARDACDLLHLDRIFFVPAHQPPHKLDQGVTDASLRLAMLLAATAADDRFEICEIELKRDGPSYTVDTLRQLHEERPAETFFLLLGADQIRDLHTWREPHEVARLSQIVLMSREGVAAGPKNALVAESIEVTRIGVSSTAVRQRVAEGRSIRYLVPAGVEKIIVSRGLYRTNGPNGADPPGYHLDYSKNEPAI